MWPRPLCYTNNVPLPYWCAFCLIDDQVYQQKGPLHTLMYALFPIDPGSMWPNRDLVEKGPTMWVTLELGGKPPCHHHIWVVGAGVYGLVRPSVCVRMRARAFFIRRAILFSYDGGFSGAFRTSVYTDGDSERRPCYVIVSQTIPGL